VRLIPVCDALLDSRKTDTGTIYQRQHSNYPTGDAQLTIQRFNNSTINYFFSASTEMKQTHDQLPLNTL
jgi:hypothetical protein